MSGFESPLRGEPATDEDIFELEGLVDSRLQARPAQIHQSRYFETATGFIRIESRHIEGSPELTSTLLMLGSIAVKDNEKVYEEIFNLGFGYGGLLESFHATSGDPELPGVIADLKEKYASEDNQRLMMLMNHAHKWAVWFGVHAPKLDWQKEIGQDSSPIVDTALSFPHMLLSDSVNEPLYISGVIEDLADDKPDYHLKDRYWNGRSGEGRTVRIESCVYLNGSLALIPPDEAHPTLEVNFEDARKGTFCSYTRNQAGEVSSGEFDAHSAAVLIRESGALEQALAEEKWPRKAHVRFLIDQIREAEEVLDDGSQSTDTED